MNACSLTQCGIAARCEARDHRARCLCPDGWRGDPYVECDNPECVVDEECPQVLACRNEKCVDPCDCAVNANCIVRSHRARCQCIPNHQGDPYTAGCFPSKNSWLFLHLYQTMSISVPVIEPECRVDGDCPSRQACLQEVCRNPCTELKPCGRNAECSVQNTLPQRTMVCMCIPGYVGDADVYCELRKILIILLSLFQFLGKIYCVQIFGNLAYHMLIAQSISVLLTLLLQLRLQSLVAHRTVSVGTRRSAGTGVVSTPVLLPILAPPTQSALCVRTLSAATVHLDSQETAFQIVTRVSKSQWAQNNRTNI